GSLWVVASDASEMILSIAWLTSSLAVMPFDSATAMSLASFGGSSGKVIVISSFFFLGDTIHDVRQKRSISQSTRRQATRSTEGHGTRSEQTTGDGRALISAH